MMDYHSLKRKELQALCKEHNIPANSANSVLADKLSALLNEKQKPKARQRTCMKSAVETTDEGEPAASKKEAKKVRFSPNNDLVEYELQSGEKQKDMVTQVKTRRKSVAKKVDEPAVDDNIAVELVEDTAQIPVTRSRVQSIVKDVIPNKEKQKGRRGAKDVVKGTEVDKETDNNIGKVTRSKANTMEKGGAVPREDNKQSKKVVKEVEEATESVKETVVGRVRVTRSKAQTSVVCGTGRDANPHAKKKTGKQVKTEEQSVEPSKEVMDIPVRGTRSTRRIVKEETGNTVTKLEDVKKRTRKEMKATDLNSNSSRVALVDNQKPSKRKPLRTRGVDEDEDDKKEAVANSRVTRSKAPLAMEDSGRNNKNKVKVKELEEPLKHAGKKIVNRRNSVLKPEKIEVDLEEAVNRPARKNTRRKSVMQKETKTVESPKDEKIITRSGEYAYENDIKEITTPKSRKRRGTPIIEDLVIETEYDFCVDKSPKASTRSVSKSGEKSVAKKQVESSIKKPSSRMNKQSSVEGKGSIIRSGAIIKDSSSKKRAKLSATKQSDSEDRAVNASQEGTPVTKMKNLKLDEVTVAEVTHAIDKSDRRFTRSVIKSEIKEPNQPAIDEQPIAKAQLFSPKVAKFKPDPAVNTAPGRITRHGVKHGGYSAGSFSEKVGKKKQTRQSAHKKPLNDSQMVSPEVVDVGINPDVGIFDWSEVKQPLDEVQMSSPEVAEVQPNSDDAITVKSQILGDLSVSDPISGTALEIEGESLVLGENASDEVMEDAGACFEKSTYDASATPCLTESGKQQSQNLSELPSSDNETPLGKNLSHISVISVSKADVAETVPDAVSDVSHVQNQNEVVYVEYGVVNEAVNLETSVLKSGSPDAMEKESDSTKSGSTLKRLQADVAIQEAPVSVGKVVVMEGVDISSFEVTAKGNDGDAENNCDPISASGGETVGLVSLQISSADKHDYDGEQYDEDESASAQKSLMPEPDSEDRGVADGVDVQDIHGECVDAISEQKSCLDMFGTPLTGKGDVRDDCINLPKELETSSELSNANKPIDVPVPCIDIDIERVLEDDNDVQDGETEHDRLTSNENRSPDEKDVGGVDSEPAQNENMAMVAEVTEVLVRSHDQNLEQSVNVSVDDVPVDMVEQSDLVMNKETPKVLATSGMGDMVLSVDAPEESVVDINKDAVSSILGDTYDLDAEGDSGNEQKLTEVDEGFQPNEGRGTFDMSYEQTKEEAKASGGMGPTLDDQEQAATTEDYTDRAKTLEDGSHIGVNEVDPELVGNIKANEDPNIEEASPILNTKESIVDGIDSGQLMGDGGAHERPVSKESSPITYKDEESPVDDTASNLPTAKEDDKNNQDGTRNTGTSVDWGDYDFEMDEFEKPVSAHRSVDVEGKDDQDTDLQTSARTSSSIEESSVRNLENSSRNAAYGKSNQEVDMLKGSASAAAMAEEAFTWSAAGSSMKSLFATPAASRISHVRDSQEDAAKFTNQDTYSSLKSFFATPATTRISHVTTGQEAAVDLANQDHYSSLKPLFKTPATTQISHVKDGPGVKIGHEDAVDFGNNDHYSSLKPLFKTPAATQNSHAKDVRDVKTGQEDAVDFANQDHYSSLKTLFKTPAVTQFSHVKDGGDVKTGQEDAVDFANQDHYSSIKSLLKTPAVTQISHVKDGQVDAVNFTGQDHSSADSSLKSLFKTPAVTQISYVKDVQEDAVDLANQAHYSSLKPLFNTSAQTSHVIGDQEDAACYVNQDPYSSLKTLFTTPATTQISHVKDAEEEATNFLDKNHYLSLKSSFATPATSRMSHVNEGTSDAVNEDFGSSRTAAHLFNHQWGNDQSKDFNSETQGNAVRGPENLMHGGPSFEDNFRKLFENEVVGGSIDRSGSNTQFHFLDEAAGASHHEPSSLEDNSTQSPMKGSEVNDDFAFDTGHAYDYRGNIQ